jgi:long-chain-fatty-acid--[acyl-carrier-protein] ligase
MLLQPIRWLAWAAGVVVLSLRYRVRVTGLADAYKHPGPYLILPNHPAYADPPNLIVRLWAAFRARPMLLGSIFHNPVLAPFGYLLRAIEVPDLAEATAEGRQQTEAALKAVTEALKAGENVVMWPSGRLIRDGTERVGANRGVSDVLAAVPNVTVVLIRTRGLWGSMFSWGYTGQRPPLMKRLVQGAGLLLANGVAFAPRRNVSVTTETFPPGTRPEPTREAVNAWLDEWYNRDQKPETPTFVPYHFLFGPRTYEFPKPPAAAAFDPSKVKPSTKQAVADILSDKLRRPAGDIALSPETTFMQLGLDSLDAMEVELEIENRFGFSGGDVPTTVGLLWAVAEGLVERAPPKPPPAEWFRATGDGGPLEILGETVPEAVLNRVRRNPRDVAAADDASGVLTYEKLLVGATVLAERFRKLPGDHVGLLLPASAAGVISLIALHLARKTPVVLNWTTGPANLAHAAKLLGVTTVVTSRKFVDRARVTVAGTESLYLEDLRATVGNLERLRRLLLVRFLPGWTIGRLLNQSKRQPDETAVVLFTSGSEKAPKAVPLTHANVIADLRGALPLLKLDRTHSALVFLPLFHSFGHTVTGLLPVFGGVKAVYHPDPTDAAGLVRKAALYKPTATAATPTFLGYMLDRAKPGELDSLRILVVGAEKCPDAVFDKAKRLAPNAVVMEGYGVTECSPVVSVNPPDAAKPGTIGLPLKGVEVCVTALDSDRVLPAGERGMLLVGGPTVFPGYVGHDGESPFREFGGKRWYTTGDLAEVGADGYLRFHGRLKRFLKAGGEMISLPALEEPFAREYPPTDAGPRVAVEGVETPGGRTVVLFTTEDVSLKDANALLQREGFRGVMRLDEVRKVDAIPVLGTGKTDYKVLRGMIGTG